MLDSFLAWWNTPGYRFLPHSHMPLLLSVEQHILPALTLGDRKTSINRRNMLAAWNSVCSNENKRIKDDVRRGWKKRFYKSGQLLIVFYPFIFVVTIAILGCQHFPSINWCLLYWLCHPVSMLEKFVVPWTAVVAYSLEHLTGHCKIDRDSLK